MASIDIIRRHPVAANYALTFAISWGAVLVTIALKGMPADKGQMEAVLPVAILSMLLGPSVSCLLMTVLVDGREGLRDLRSRLGMWRAGARWYAMALLLAPVVVMTVLMSLSAFSDVYVPGVLTRADRMARLTMGLVSALMVGVCEELGWTGFVTPRLRKRYGVLETGLIIGVLWGTWHIVPMAILPSIAYSEPLPPEVYAAVRTLGFLVGDLVAFRVLMLWTYDSTRSLPLLMVMHFGLTAANIIYEPEALVGISNFVYDFAVAATFWALVAAVVVAMGWQMEGRRPYVSKRGTLRVGDTGPQVELRES